MSRNVSNHAKQRFWRRFDSQMPRADVVRLLRRVVQEGKEVTRAPHVQPGEFDTELTRYFILDGIVAVLLGKTIVTTFPARQGDWVLKHREEECDSE